MNPWLQLVIEVKQPQIEALEQALLNAGAAAVTLREYQPKGEAEQAILEPPLGETPLWDNTRLIGLFDASCNTQATQRLIAKAVEFSPQFRWEQLEDKDWEREWMANYHAIQCAPNLWICPSWQTPPDPNATNLLLDPGLAFGTGTHPTTFLCMQWLAEQDLNNKTMMDYGCGSGILGIAGLLLGALTSTGVDIDPQALIATQGNVKRNHLDTERLPLFLPKEVEPHKTVDILTANILAGPLVELALTLINHLTPGGKICLSGILDKQAINVIKAYEEEIDFEPKTQKEGWIRLNGTRKIR